MNTKNVMKCAAYLTPLDIEIIRLVSEGVKVKKIAKAVQLDRRAVQRHISIIADIIREVCYNV